MYTLTVSMEDKEISRTGDTFTETEDEICLTYEDTYSLIHYVFFKKNIICYELIKIK